MNLMIVSILLSCYMPDPQTPNFYAGFNAAREASKKSQKEMVIFFTEASCTSCASAWSAYTSDPDATRQYISTKMDKGDFDGGVFFDLLDLEETPSWVIFSPDGKEKERWTGKWKGSGTKSEERKATSEDRPEKREDLIAKSQDPKAIAQDEQNQIISPEKSELHNE